MHSANSHIQTHTCTRAPELRWYKEKELGVFLLMLYFQGSLCSVLIFQLTVLVSKSWVIIELVKADCWVASETQIYEVSNLCCHL